MTKKIVLHASLPLVILIFIIGVLLVLLIGWRGRPSPSISPLGPTINPSQDLNPRLAFVKDGILFPTAIDRTTLRYLAGQSPEFIDLNTTTGNIAKRYPIQLPRVIAIEYSPNKTKVLIESEIDSLSEARFSIYYFDTLTIESLPAATQTATWTPSNYLLSAEHRQGQTVIVLTRGDNQTQELQRTKLLVNKLYPLNDTGDALLYSIDDESTSGRLHKITKGKIEPYYNQLTGPPTLAGRRDRLWLLRQGKTELVELESHKTLTVVVGQEPALIVFSPDGQSSFFAVERSIKLDSSLEPLRQDSLLRVNHTNGATTPLLPLKSIFRREIHAITTADNGLYLVSDFTLYKLKIP